MTGQMMKTHTAPIFMISIIIFMHSTNSSLSVLFVGFIYFKSFYLGNLLAGCDWQPWKKKSAIQRTDIKFPHAALPVCLSSSGPQQKSKRTSEHLSVVTLKVWSGILSSSVTHKSCLGGVPWKKRKCRVILSPKYSPSHQHLWLREFPCRSLTHVGMLTASSHTYTGPTASCGKTLHFLNCNFLWQENIFDICWVFFIWFLSCHLLVSLDAPQFWTGKRILISLCHPLGGTFGFWTFPSATQSPFLLTSGLDLT